LKTGTSGDVPIAVVGGVRGVLLTRRILGQIRLKVLIMREQRLDMREQRKDSRERRHEAHVLVDKFFKLAKMGNA
jgi:hypothetical protein